MYNNHVCNVKMMHIERLMNFFSNINMMRFILWEKVANYAVNVIFNGGWNKLMKN